MICAVQGCPTPAPVPRVTVFCPRHRREFGRQVANAAPWVPGARTRSEVEERVYQRLGSPRSFDHHWTWTGDLSDGHPVVRGDGARYLYADEVVAGGPVVGRVCAQPTCLNPRHLITKETAR